MIKKSNKHPRSINGYLLLKCNLILGAVVTLSLYSQWGMAFSFLTFEARSAAMGGVGVATGTRNASFYNPALLATPDESYDWYAVVPSFSESSADPDGLEGRLTTYQSNQTNGTLIALSDVSLRERDNLAVTLGVPSTIISGTVFVNQHNFHTINTSIEPGNAANSFIKHRSAEIREFGFNLAKPINIKFLNFGDIKIGAGLKLLLVDGFADDQAVNSATADHVRTNEPAESSALNLDFGVARELGVWNMALVVKNVFSSHHRFGTSEDVIEIEPQVRAGFAFRSRRSIYEVDLDLVKSKYVGHEDESQYLSGGWEHRVIPGMSLRLGYRQNLVGDALPTFSYGIGAEFFGFVFDFAGMTNSDEESFFAQFTIQQ